MMVALIIVRRPLFVGISIRGLGAKA